jgi:hypothetical protein
MHYFTLLSMAFMLTLAVMPRLYAPVAAGSTTSTVKATGTAQVRTAPTVVLNLGTGTLVLNTSLPSRAVTKNGRLEGTTVSTTKSPSMVNTLTGQPSGGVLSNYLDLGGFTTTLTSPLEFNTERWPFNGSINLNNTTVRLNGPSAVTEPVTFIDAAGLTINNMITLTDTWTFDGDGAISGSGGVLDLGGGGILFLHPNTAVSLNNLVLKGLGDTAGKIIFSDQTSQLRLSNAQLEFTDNYTFTTGGIYVEGPTTIVTGDKILTLSTAASMTVDGVSLLYDTLSFADQQNIYPTLGADTNHKNIIALNNGVIRQVNAPISGDVHYSQSASLSELTVVHPSRRLRFDETLTLNGQGYSLLFAQASTPLITVAANKKVTLQDIKLEYFSPSLVTLGNSASLYCNNGTNMTLAKDEDLTMSFTFRGACTINGAGHALTLGASGALMVMGHKSSLLLENMTIKNLSGNQLRCMDNTCTVSLNNVKFELDGAYSLTAGSFVIIR